MESVFVSFWRFHSSFSDVSTLPLPYRHRKHTLFYVSTHEVRKKTRVFVFKCITASQAGPIAWHKRRALAKHWPIRIYLVPRLKLDATSSWRRNVSLVYYFFLYFLILLSCILLFYFFIAPFSSFLRIHSLSASFIIFSTFLLFHFCLTILPSFLIFLSYSLFFFSGLMPLVFFYRYFGFLLQKIYRDELITVYTLNWPKVQFNTYCHRWKTFRDTGAGNDISSK